MIAVNIALKQEKIIAMNVKMDILEKMVFAKNVIHHVKHAKIQNMNVNLVNKICF